MQIAAITADKATRTPAQQKLDSQLIYAARANLNQAIVQGAPELKPDIKIQNGNWVLVDIQATVSAALLQEIVRVGGRVVSSFPNEKAIRALLPLPAIEGIAARPEVRFIQRAIEFETDATPQTAKTQNTKTSAAPTQTPEIASCQIANCRSSGAVLLVARVKARRRRPTPAV